MHADSTVNSLEQGSTWGGLSETASVDAAGGASGSGAELMNEKAEVSTGSSLGVELMKSNAVNP